MARTRRGFGTIRRLPSGNWQVTYIGPDGERHAAPRTFRLKGDAETWADREHSLIRKGTWSAPAGRGKSPGGLTFGVYAERWLAGRGLKASTRALYRGQLDRHLLPTFADVPLTAITPADVRAWHASMDPKHKRVRSQSYGLLRTILGTALTEELIVMQPCTMRGASNTKPEHVVNVAKPEELDSIAVNLPPRLALWPLLAMWCALRRGEICELRRKDFDLARGTVRIARGAVYVRGGVGWDVGTPKSRAGLRTLPIPPEILPAVVAHLAEHTAPGANSLLFPMHPGGDRQITTGWWHKMAWQSARAAAGRSDLHMHDLRHTGATLFAQTGGTAADIKAFVGHDSDAAAMRYQHSAERRTAQIAARMGDTWRLS